MQISLDSKVVDLLPLLAGEEGRKSVLSLIGDCKIWTEDRLGLLDSVYRSRLLQLVSYQSERPTHQHILGFVSHLGEVRKQLADSMFCIGFVQRIAMMEQLLEDVMSHDDAIVDGTEKPYRYSSAA